MYTIATFLRYASEIITALLIDCTRTQNVFSVKIIIGEAYEKFQNHQPSRNGKLILKRYQFLPLD